MDWCRLDKDPHDVIAVGTNVFLDTNYSVVEFMAPHGTGLKHLRVVIETEDGTYKDVLYLEVLRDYLNQVRDQICDALGEL